MSTTTAFGGRIDASRATLTLAVGDVLLIAAFVVLGELRHGYGPLADPGRVVGTAIPFLLGWVLVSVVAGVYAPDVRESVRAAAGRTALAWIGAALIGHALRATPVFHGGLSPAFVAVSLGVVLALLVPWRVAYAGRSEIVRRLGHVRRYVTGRTDRRA